MFAAFSMLTGTVVTDLILRNTRDGGEALNFRVACNHRRLDLESNSWVDTSSWFVSVACFNALARNAFSTLYKGAPVVAIGTMRTNTWVDKDGAERSRDELRPIALGPDLVRCAATLARRQPAPAEQERIDADDAVRNSEPDEAFGPIEEEVPVPA
ncbi:MAG TPA: single-stranded DNA-binding protein [Aldersonia sp.]